MGFDPTRYGPHFTYNSGVVIGGVNPVQALPLNPYRVGLLLSSSSGTINYMWVIPPTAMMFHSIFANSEPTHYSLTTHGPLVQQQVWIGSGAGQFVFTEILYQAEAPGE